MMFLIFCLFLIFGAIIFLLCSPMFTGILLGYVSMLIDKVKRFLNKE